MIFYATQLYDKYKTTWVLNSLNTSSEIESRVGKFGFYNNVFEWE